MDNPYEIIDKRLERIELLLENLVFQTKKKNIKKNNTTKTKMPTEDEMDAYILKTVFSEKKS
ncbi:hypothetical protein [Maribacter luteus]|uniref:Uncharacterized protein n=1 Tax=Maribacter luteus TaxID=2594478 RepID=A0A6I2MJ37_9FLAO|nr:hypothetical protein [Maribacter luteus]MRX62580.1 hypothetical protein [Maribacter luteus]